MTAVVFRIALSHPEVAFRYIRDGKEEAVTPEMGIYAPVYIPFWEEISQRGLCISRAKARRFL